MAIGIIELPAYEEQPITVYAVLGHMAVPCEYGEHVANIVTVKRLGPVIGTREYHNGYETLMTDLRVDAQNRVYHQHIQVDYSSNVTWWRDDGMSFRTRLPHGEVVIDAAGRRLQ